MRNGTARDIAMKGGGYYSRATIGAKHVIDGATPLILNSLDNMSPPDDARSSRCPTWAAPTPGPP